MIRDIQEYADLKDLVDYAVGRYNTWRSFAEEVENVWKGTYGVPHDVEDGQTKIVRPSRPGNTLRKLERMLGVRAHLSIEVPPRDNTDGELQRVETVEAWLRAYEEYHQIQTGRNVLREAVFWELLRGRGGLKTTLHEEDEDLPIWMEAPDPMTLYPLRTKRGIAYVAGEYFMTRLELKEYLDSLSDDQFQRLRTPDVLDKLAMDEKGEALDVQPWDLYRVTEYWDDEQYAWAVDAYLMAVGPHPHGGVPYVEARFNSTPIDDERWASQGLLGPVLEDLKQIAILQAKLAGSVETFYYPLILYEDPSGTFQVYEARSAGQPINVAEGTKVTVLNPTSNHQLVETLLAHFERDAGQGTLNPVVFTTDLPNVSGFMVSQILSTVKDDVSDYQDAIQMMKGSQLGQMLRLMEENADTQENGEWRVPVFGGKNGRKKYATLTADDIDGHYVVRVKLTLDLPQDRLQKATAFNQLYQTDPLTGRPRLDFRTALELSELDESIEDVGAMLQRIDWEWLKYQDPEILELYTAKVKAEYADELKAFRKEVKKAERRSEREAVREAEREAEQGLTEDLVLQVPAEQRNDPAFWEQVHMAVAQGQDPRSVIELLTSEQGLPLGVPGAESGPPAPDEGQPASSQYEDLVASLLGQGPDGFTGYGGIAPAQLPPAMQGAQPRQVTDQARLQVEQDQTLARRGGLPPAR